MTLKQCFVSLYFKEESSRPSLDLLFFAAIEKINFLGGKGSFWSRRCTTRFLIWGVTKPQCLIGFPIAIYQHFWSDVEDEIIAFMKEFHLRGNLSKNTGAYFIALILKKLGLNAQEISCQEA